MKKYSVLLLALAMPIASAAQTTWSKPSAARATAPAEERDAPPARQSPATHNVAPASPLALPVGTAVKMKLETALSTRTNKPGDKFSGRVTEPVMLNGRTIIPVGAALEGKVMRADEPRRIRGTPTLDLRPDLVVLPNGERFAINAVLVDTSARPAVEVNDEGKIKGRGHDGSDLKETGIGTAAGATIGGLAAGGKGLLIGAGVGATATVIHWLTKTRSADVPAGTEIVMELNRPVTLSSADSGQ
jgi:hypothetical protein